MSSSKKSPVVAPAKSPAPATKSPAPAMPVEAPVVAAKPVAVQAPVVETKVTPKLAVKTESSVPVVDALKPVAVIQENLRANTEKAISAFRGNYAEVKGRAETATTHLEDSLKAAQTGTREIGVALFEIAKAQTHANLDHAKQLAAAKSLPDLVNAQQAFVLSQLQSAQTRAKDVATLAGKIAADVTAPLRASFELMLRR